MPKLTLVADITAHPDHIDALKTALNALIAPTRAEDGCVQYDLHQNNENPAHFIFFEIWESRDLWQNHMNSSHIAAHGQATEGMVTNVVLNEMTQIG